MNNDGSWAGIIIPFVLILLIIFGTNSCSSGAWNSGKCPECETRYELRGVSKGLKYYACPDCGKEVERF